MVSTEYRHARLPLAAAFTFPAAIVPPLPRLVPQPIRRRNRRKLEPVEGNRLKSSWNPPISSTRGHYRPLWDHSTDSKPYPGVRQVKIVRICIALARPVEIPQIDASVLSTTRCRGGGLVHPLDRPAARGREQKAKFAIVSPMSRKNALLSLTGAAFAGRRYPSPEDP